MINSHVIVLGYMGCGKSTIARKLSSIIDIPFIDLDKYIETKYNMTIPEIFDSEGEIKFREIEKETLEKLLMQKDKIIISTGGGTPCYFENMQYILNSSSNVFFMFGSLKNCKKKRKVKTDMVEIKIKRDCSVKNMLVLIITNTINKTVKNFFPSL